MSLQFDTTTQGNWATTLNTNVGINAKLNIYTGAPPANCGTADAGTLIAQLSCSATAFGTVTGSTITVNAITSASASTSGTAGHFRVLDSGGTVHMQGTVATSGGDLTITNTSITSGETVSVSSWTLTAPGA